MLFLSLDDLLNGYGKCLLLHLFEPKRRVLIILLELLGLHCRGLSDDAPHDLIVLSIDALCLPPFEDVIK